MVILRSQNKITDFFMLLAWASPFNYDRKPNYFLNFWDNKRFEHLPMQKCGHIRTFKSHKCYNYPEKLLTAFGVISVVEVPAFTQPVYTCGVGCSTSSSCQTRGAQHTCTTCSQSSSIIIFSSLT